MRTQELEDGGVISPDGDEALMYEDASGLDLARRVGHVLLQVRKRAARWGDTPETDKRIEAYTQVLLCLREAGVEQAEVILEESLRQIQTDAPGGS
jgi:hypothetical protein